MGTGKQIENILGNNALHFRETNEQRQFFLEIRRTGPDDIKLFSYSTQLYTKSIRLINIKMPTIVGILTTISMINTTSEILKAVF